MGKRAQLFNSVFIIDHQAVCAEISSACYDNTTIKNEVRPQPISLQQNNGPALITGPQALSELGSVTSDVHAV